MKKPGVHGRGWDCALATELVNPVMFDHTSGLQFDPVAGKASWLRIAFDTYTLGSASTPLAVFVGRTAVVGADMHFVQGSYVQSHNVKKMQMDKLVARRSSCREL